jgi:type IV pilus assembly protein PilA
MKKCPYCAEAIQDDVVVCPLCRMNLAANVYSAPQAQPAAPSQPVIPGDAVRARPTGEPQTSGKALGSLIAGIAAYVIVPFLGAIVAVILGHLGLSEIKKSAGRLKGDGMAIAGMVLGYVQFAGIPFILIIAAIAIPNLLKSRMAANEASAVGSLRSYNYAMDAYAVQCPKIGFPHALSNLASRGEANCDHAHLLDDSLAVDRPTKSGYYFVYAPGPVNQDGQITSFELRAEPVTPGTSGQRHFYEDQNGVIHYSREGSADSDSPALQ